MVLFVVKKLIRNSGNRWDSVSLFSEDGYFRGEAIFESRDETQKYLELYKKRVNSKLNFYGKAKTTLKLRVFEEETNAINQLPTRR